MRLGYCSSYHLFYVICGARIWRKVLYSLYKMSPCSLRARTVGGSQARWEVQSTRSRICQMWIFLYSIYIRYPCGRLGFPRIPLPRTREKSIQLIPGIEPVTNNFNKTKNYTGLPLPMSQSFSRGQIDIVACEVFRIPCQLGWRLIFLRGFVNKKMAMLGRAPFTVQYSVYP